MAMRIRRMPNEPIRLLVKFTAGQPQITHYVGDSCPGGHMTGP
jgi:hypothetical protein